MTEIPSIKSESDDGAVPKYKMVVFDADNTIWTWDVMTLTYLDAFTERLAEVMVRREEGCDGMEMEGIFSEELKRLIAARRIKIKKCVRETIEESLEFLPLIQNMNIVTEWLIKYYEECIRHHIEIDIVRDFKKLRERTEYEKLRLYPGIIKILNALRDIGIARVIVSDAPLNRIKSRLKNLDISHYFEAVFGQPDLLSDDKDGTSSFLGNHGPVENRLINSPVLAARKPNINLAQLLDLTQEEVRESVVVIGDNIDKDALLAEENECDAILAEYGAQDEEVTQRLGEYGKPQVVGRNAADRDGYEEKVARLGSRLKIARFPLDILRYVL